MNNAILTNVVGAQESVKPRLRGYLHAAGFITACCGTVVFIFLFALLKYDYSVLIYFLVQMTCFGLSSTYHLLNVSPRIKKILQKLDHMGIFLLIAGTQTAVVLAAPKKFPVDVSFSIKSTWAIAIIGIAKILLQ